MPLCRNKSRKAKLPKGTVPQVCDDACMKAVYAQDRERKQARAAARALKPKPARKKPKSIARLVDEAAVLLQKLVRMKAADENGLVRSFTNPKKVMHWTEAQGSHFIQRNRLATKLLEENVHPQTPGENMYDMKTASGVLDYRRAMVDFYGEDFVRWLELESKKTKKYTRHEVEGIIFDLKRQIQEQEQRLSGQVSKPMEKVA